MTILMVITIFLLVGLGVCCVMMLEKYWRQTRWLAEVSLQTWEMLQATARINDEIASTFQAMIETAREHDRAGNVRRLERHGKRASRGSS